MLREAISGRSSPVRWEQAEARSRISWHRRSRGSESDSMVAMSFLFHATQDGSVEPTSIHYLHTHNHFCVNSEARSHSVRLVELACGAVSRAHCVSHPPLSSCVLPCFHSTDRMVHWINRSEPHASRFSALNHESSGQPRPFASAFCDLLSWAIFLERYVSHEHQVRADRCLWPRD